MDGFNGLILTKSCKDKVNIKTANIYDKGKD